MEFYEPNPANLAIKNVSYFILFFQGEPNFYKATDIQLKQLIEWAKHIPYFTSLPTEDQVLLLRAGMFKIYSFPKDITSISIVMKQKDVTHIHWIFQEAQKTDTYSKKQIYVETPSEFQKIPKIV